MQHATCSRERATCNRELATCNRELATCNRELATCRHGKNSTIDLMSSHNQNLKKKLESKHESLKQLQSVQPTDAATCTIQL